MCRFFSYKEAVGEDKKVHILYLDDVALFKADGTSSDKMAELLKDGSRDRDFMGHGAICAYYGIKDNEAGDQEVRNIWNGELLPKELRSKFKDGETVIRNFGQMLRTYAPAEDLDYLRIEAPRDDRWRALGSFAEEILRFQRRSIVAELVKSATMEEFSLSPDDNSSISQLLKTGRYDWKNSDINDGNFPKQDVSSSSSAKTQHLINFNTDIRFTCDAEFALEALGYRPGTSRETLRFGTCHPEVQRKVWIAGLGDDWQGPGGHRRVVVLTGRAGSRYADLYYRRRGWSGYYRFLAFAK